MTEHERDPDLGAGQPQYPADPGQPQYPADPGQPQYPADPYARPSYDQTAQYPVSYGTIPQPPSQQQPGRKRSGPLVAGVTALALVVGGAAGGIGGYLVADQAPGTTVNALEQDRPAEQTGSAPEGSVTSVAEKMTPSVVRLQVVGRGGGGEGSGFLITDDGFILTNNHVVEPAANGGEITVIFPDGDRATGEVVGTDPTTDIAVVRAEGVTGKSPVELGRSDDLRVGQQVVAIGSPFELSGTVTSGIISALQRPVRAGGERGDLATVMDAVQTDAAINPGNSGGPLVDMNGRVIGINSAIYSPRGASDAAGNVGIGFAIPIDQARRIADQLMKTGTAQQTFIGATVTDNEGGGASIVDVSEGEAAQKAGLKSGDVVTKLGDRVIEDADELVAAIRSRAPGEEVTLTLQSGQTLQVTLGSKPVRGG